MFALKGEPEKALNFYGEAQHTTEEMIGKGTPHWLMLELNRNVGRTMREKGEHDGARKRLQEFLSEAVSIYGEKTVFHAMYHYEMGQLEEE